MISRLLTTIVLALLSAAAFLSQAGFAARSDGALFLFVGLLLLGLAVLNWFAWDAIREGWHYGGDARRDGVNLPVFAGFAPVYIKSVLNFLAGNDPRRAKPGSSKKAAGPLD